MGHDLDKRLELLKEKIQDAISDYVYETGDERFYALVEVQAENGWTKQPQIKEYKHFLE